MRLAIPFLTALLVGCGGTPTAGSAPAVAPADQWFEDVTAAAGLHFVHDAGPTGTYSMPQVIGSGAALFDADGDGRLDVYLLQNGGPKSGSTNRLFLQRPDGTFRDATEGSGLGVAGYGMGVAAGDVNNDGRPDLFVSEYGAAHLFLNKGGATFADVTRAAGIDHLLWGASCTFVDYDRDGWLDLVVVNYVDIDPTRPCRLAGGQRDYCGPTQFPGTVTNLYRNRGKGEGATEGSFAPSPLRPFAPSLAPPTPLFEDVTLKSGLGKRPGPGLGVVCADFDGDRWPDLLVANDAAANHLWVNRRDGTFAEEAAPRGLALNGLGLAQGNMGVATGDVDGDGLLDVFITHLTEETHTLWRQGPAGLFRDETGPAGLARSRWRGTGFGTVLADFDLDGAPDLAVVNGRVARGRPAGEAELGPFWSLYAERNQLFAGAGGGRFRDVSEENPAFCARPGVYRSLAVGDVDNDGRLDLLVTAIAGPARLYRNVAPRRGHWLTVRAIDPALKRDAYGAAVTVEAGGRKRVGLVNPGHSFLASNDPRAHFGLGEASRLEAVRVLWPDGTEEVFPGVEADRVLELRKGAGRPR